MNPSETIVILMILASAVLTGVNLIGILTRVMKKDLHPADYRPTVIKDSNSGFAFLTRTTAQTTETIKWEDGNEYPLLTVHISSASHPFYTGEEKIMDVEGRVDRFKARQQAAADQKLRLAGKAKKRAFQAAKKPVREERTKVGAKLGVPSRPTSQKKLQVPVKTEEK